MVQGKMLTLTLATQLKFPVNLTQMQKHCRAEIQENRLLQNIKLIRNKKPPNYAKNKQQMQLLKQEKDTQEHLQMLHTILLNSRQEHFSQEKATIIPVNMNLN